MILQVVFYFKHVLIFLVLRIFFFTKAINDTSAHTPSKIVNGIDSIITDEMQAKVAPTKLIQI